MTIASQATRADYVGNGVTTVFAYPFRILAATDLVVTSTDLSGNVTTLVYVTNYAVSGVGSPSGGSVTLTAPLTTGYALAILRVMDVTQPTNFANLGRYFASVHERAIDRVVMLVQQVANTISTGSLATVSIYMAGVVNQLTPALAQAALGIGSFVRSLLAVASAGAFRTAIGGTPTVVATLAALKALSGADLVGSVVVSGYATASDLGGGVFWWNGADSTADNAGTVIQPNAGGVGRWLRVLPGKEYNVRWFGAKGDNATNDTTAIATAKTVALAAAGTLHFPSGTYLSATPLAYTTACRIRAEPGARLKLTAAAPYVVSIDGSATSNIYGADVRDLILDGVGHCADGLVLKNVISSYFLNVRVTNVTGAGFRWGWAQLCTFVNPVCSGNLEAFTTTPVNGLLVDGAASSSANTIINPTFEKVSGSGIKGLSLINSTFISGTSESNAIGIEFGETPDVGRVALGNSVIAMDMEVNATADVVLRLTASENNFWGARTGTGSPPVQITGAKRNNWIGGSSSGFTLDGVSQNNDIQDVSLYGAGAIVADAGLNNTIRNVYNINTAAQTPDKEMRRRGNNVPANGGTVTINAALVKYVVITAGAAVAGFTVAAPTNPGDGYDLDVCIHNTSGGVITTTWNAAFKVVGWVEPASGFCRTARFRYDGNYGFWYLQSVTGADQVT